MVKSALIVIEDDPECWRIGWHFGGSEAVMGTILGSDDEESETEPDREKNRDDWEHWTATRAAAKARPLSDDNGFYWPSRRQAKIVLAQITCELAGSVPWPDWAKTAAAEGWKPPKDWRP